MERIVLATGDRRDVAEMMVKGLVDRRCAIGTVSRPEDPGCPV